MYRQTNKVLKNYRKAYTNRNNVSSQQNNDFVSPQDIPELRRVIDITDYDSGEPITHKLELYKTDRIDCYKVYVDGKLWKERIGWSKILAGIRKALPRLVR
jgi:D-lyxose ketol-isomerase